MKRTFEALTTVVSISSDADVTNLELARMIVAAYPESSRRPQLTFRLRGGSRPAVICEGSYETVVESLDDVVPLFEIDLYHALVEHAKPGWLLHAAALERDGRAVVLAGPSGAGKTTLTLALVGRGWRVATEEIVLVEANATVHGLARPIHLTGAALVPRGWQHMEYAMRSRTGEIVRSVIAHPPSPLRTYAPLPLRALVRIGHGREQQPEWLARAGGEALTDLWECTLRQDDAGLETATTLLRRFAAHRLRCSSIEEAVALVEAHVSS